MPAGGRGPRGCGEDAAALWRHIPGRLPDVENAFRSDVAWFALLAVAGGVERYDALTAVHELCLEAGWVEVGGGATDRYSVSELMWPPLVALIGARWNSR